MRSRPVIIIFALLAALMLAAVSCRGYLVPDDGTASPKPTAAPSAGISDVVINEVVSANKLCHVDAKLGAVDWIELKNVSDGEADISGWRLSDSPTFARCLTFPDGTTIPAGGFLTVFCVAGYVSSGDETALVAPFSISRSGEKLYLSASSSETSLVSVPYLIDDFSYARREDGSFGFSAAPTFGTENADVYAALEEAASSVVSVDALRISELVNGKSGWAEVVNITDETVNTKDYYLTDDPEDPAKWQFPDMELAPGERLLVALTDADIGIPVAASFKLSRTETTLLMFNSLRVKTDEVTIDPAMPAGVSAVVTENGVAYTAFPTPGEPNSGRTFDKIEWTAMDPASAPLIINEVLADNKYGIVDCCGDRSDWVELLNTTDSPVYLTNYYLSDDPADPMKWQLPNVALLPHEYALIFLSGNETEGNEIHAPFKLSPGETMILSTLDGMLFDSIEIPEEISPNVSVGRNGKNELRYYAAPTPGGSNSTYGSDKVADAGGFNARSVYISEVSAVAPARSGELDWVELFNGSSETIDLNGWSLTDDPDEPRKFVLSGKLASGAYKVISCSSTASSGGSKAPFSVSNTGDTLYLFTAEGAVRDVFSTGMTTVGVTSGRAANSQLGERCFFTSATRGAKNGTPLPGYVAEPVFSSSKLFSGEAFSLKITCATAGASIRYTTDGSVPTQNSKLYSGPITVSTGTVVRAKAFLSGLVPSPAATRTFLIGKDHTLPVVCLAMSSSDYSRMYKAVMSQNGGVTHGDEVPCSMEYYIDGRLAISSGAGIRVSGASTAVYPQKSLCLYFRAGYGRSSLDFPLFSGCKVKSFRSLVLRNGGQDAYYARIRDAYMSRICRGLDIDVSYVQPVVVYLNGQYFGVYDMKENMNEDYVASHYGVKRGSVEIAKRNGYMLAGSKDNWNEMLNMCKTLDCSIDSNFEKVARLVDTDSIIDYLIARTYFYDGDMFNQKYWHTAGNTVKWRAVFYDSDFALYGNSASASILSAYFNRAGVTSFHGYVTQMDIYCALNMNKTWRDKFITRYIYVVKYKFNAERALAAYDKLLAEYEPEMSRHIAKWHMPSSMSKWESETSALRACIKARPEKALANLKRFYGLTSEQYAQYEKAADRMANN